MIENQSGDQRNEREAQTDGGNQPSSNQRRENGSKPFNRRSYLKGAVAVGVLGGLGSGTASGSSNNDKVLILEPTVTDGEDSLEADSAAALGFDVEVVSESTWAGMSTADFAEYRAIILGDPTCVTGTAPISAAEANVGTWGPAVTGNVVVLGTDPQWHSTYGPGGAQGGDEVTEGGINFATADPDHTGAYITLSCYYDNAPAETPVPVLDGFGTFTATQVPGCFNDIAVVATHPNLTGYTEANLGNWNCSVHNAFDNWPIDFEVVGLALEGDAFTAPDGTEGTPYIVARGVEPISDITLAPDTADVPVGQSHELTATVEFDDDPLEDAEVTFTVIDGPHETTSGTGTTDAAGEATFSYTGTAMGEDTAEAEFTDPSSITQRSNRVTVTWVEPESECVDLIAGQEDVVGEVCVTNDGDTLEVTYTTDEGCELIETHLAVGDDLDEYEDEGWVNKAGNPRPGRFPYSDDHDPTDEQTYEISLDEFDAESGEDLVIAAHAVVECDNGRETAWGEGEEFEQKKGKGKKKGDGNWAMHFPYEVR